MPHGIRFSPNRENDHEVYNVDSGELVQGGLSLEQASELQRKLDYVEEKVEEGTKPDQGLPEGEEPAPDQGLPGEEEEAEEEEPAHKRADARHKVRRR